VQAPGLHQDSAASGLLHVRNEHAIVQYGINGVLLADAVARFGQVPELDWIADLELDAGSLPAQRA
jgi:hypothetical protein